MYTKKIIWFGKTVTLACDGKCEKSFGITTRPKVNFDEDEPDDFAFLADNEVEHAPQDPGTYEGGQGKPSDPTRMNKWCSRECERSKIVEEGVEVKLPDFSIRLYNQPWKHIS